MPAETPRAERRATGSSSLPRAAGESAVMRAVRAWTFGFAGEETLFGRRKSEASLLGTLLLRSVPDSQGIRT